MEGARNLCEGGGARLTAGWCEMKAGAEARASAEAGLPTSYSPHLPYPAYLILGGGKESR